MDSVKKKTGISGNRKDNALFRCLNSLTDSVTSVINQARLRRGTNTDRDRRKVNPPSMRLNPNSKSNFAPIIRITGSWVKKIAMPLKIISFAPYPFRSFHCLYFIRSFSKKYSDNPKITASSI